MDTITATEIGASHASTATRLTRRTALVAAATGMGLAATSMGRQTTQAAQEATPVASPEAEASYLFVQAGFTAGTITPDASGDLTISLQGAPAQTIFFSDRPNRFVGAVQTQQFLDVLGFDPSDPPNAALVIQPVAGGVDEVDVVVLELLAPVYDPVAMILSYTGRVLEGFTELEATGTGFTVEPLEAAAIPATVGACTLFIDSMLGCSPWDPRC